MDVPNDTDALKFLDLLESLGLEQHVTEPTHIRGHTLDLVITRKIEDILASPPAESLSNNVVLTGLCDRGNSHPITPLDLDVLVEDYTTTLSQVLDRHAPLKTKTVRGQKTL